MINFTQHVYLFVHVMSCHVMSSPGEEGGSVRRALSHSERYQRHPHVAEAERGVVEDVRRRIAS